LAEVLANRSDPERNFECLLDYEVTHQVKYGFYRIVFTALTLSDDAEVNAALVSMYRRFQKLLKTQVESARHAPSSADDLSADDATWAWIGLATVSNVIRELKLLKRYPNLWGDTAVLGSAGRVRDLRRRLDEGSEVQDRLLHGSDFPFPSVPAAFEAMIGKDASTRITNEKNWIEQDYARKVALGIGLESARRAYRLAMPDTDRVNRNDAETEGGSVKKRVNCDPPALQPPGDSL